MFGKQLKRATIQIYSLFDSCRALEIYREFSEEATSIALHPSGLYVLVGFMDKLRLMNILIDDIKQFKEFTIRGCKEVSHSKSFFNFFIQISC